MVKSTPGEYHKNKTKQKNGIDSKYIVSFCTSLVSKLFVFLSNL